MTRTKEEEEEEEVQSFFPLFAFNQEFPWLKPDKNKNNMNPTEIEKFFTRLGKFLADNDISATSDLQIQAIEGRMTIITATEVGNTRILVWDNESEGQEVASWQE